MTLQQLKYAVTIAEKGSISNAAKTLFISQPSLTNAIKDLENEIKIKIFERTNRGIRVSSQGGVFLGYARQVIEQTSLLEEKYLNAKPVKKHLSVSTQHYSFAVNAFVNLIQYCDLEEYDFTLRETRTHEILEDIKNFRSEIGILYVNDFNKNVIFKLIKEYNLKFEELFIAKPHVFISSSNPLNKLKQVTLKDLEEYPYLSFEQGEHNSFYYSEEILSIIKRKKNIKVSDRATLFNLLIGLKGYTICTGILDEELNGKDIVALPLKVDETIRVGIITHKSIIMNNLGEKYIQTLKKYAKDLI